MGVVESLHQHVDHLRDSGDERFLNENHGGVVEHPHAIVEVGKMTRIAFELGIIRVDEADCIMTLRYKVVVAHIHDPSYRQNTPPRSSEKYWEHRSFDDTVHSTGNARDRAPYPEIPTPRRKRVRPLAWRR